MLVQITELVEIVKIASTLITLTMLSIQDWKTRELDGRIVYTYFLISVILFFISTITTRMSLEMLLFYAGFSITATSGLFIILYSIGLVGDGDVYVATALGLMFPYTTIYHFTPQSIGILPPCMVIVFYASLSALTLMIVNALYILVKHRDIVSRIPAEYRFIVPFIGRPVKIHEYLQGKFKHYFPLQVFEVKDEKVLVNFKLFTSIKSEETLLLRDLINKGLLNTNDYIWVTPGLPFIFYLLIGFIMMLIVADKPILLIASKITSLK